MAQEHNGELLTFDMRRGGRRPGRRSADRSVTEALAERDFYKSTLERHRTMPIIPLLLGALVERGWTIYDDAYVDRNGDGYPDIAGALLAQSLREQRDGDWLADEDIADDPDDPAQRLVHRTMEAVQRAIEVEFAANELAPNVTVLASVPPHGRIGIATTEPDLTTAMYALNLGLGSVKRIIHVQAGRQ